MTTSYERYIRPDKLPRVRPTAGLETPDEQFFIRTHQAFEIWFGQILTELEFARAKLSVDPVPEQDVPQIARHVRRAAAIFDLLHAHLPVLETLLTTDFFDFRQGLFGAGGVESYRFREIEWIMGFRDSDLLEFLAGNQSWFGSDYENLHRYQQAEAQRLAGTNERSPATTNALRSREDDLKHNNTLRHHLLAWLRRTPFPNPDGVGPPAPQFVTEFVRRFTANFKAAYQSDLDILTKAGSFAGGQTGAQLLAAVKKIEWFLSRPERCAIIFVLQFAHHPRLTAPAELLEATLALDGAFVNWRERHIEMVARVIGGGRISTMGAADSGLSYLRGTTSKRAFPEIWDARSFLLGHAEVQGIYEGSRGEWGEWLHYRLAFEVL